MGEETSEIKAMMDRTHALYLSAYEKLNEARAAARELAKRMLEVYGVGESKDDRDHTNRQP